MSSNNEVLPGDPHVEARRATSDLIEAVRGLDGWSVNRKTEPPLIEYFAYTCHGVLSVSRDIGLTGYIEHSAGREEMPAITDMHSAIQWIEGNETPRETFREILADGTEAVS